MSGPTAAQGGVERIDRLSLDYISLNVRCTVSSVSPLFSFALKRKEESIDFSWKLQLAVLSDFSVVTQQRPYLHFSHDCDFRPVVIGGALDFPERPAGRCSSHFRPRHHGNRMISNVHLTCSRSMVMAFPPCLASPTTQK